MPLPWRVTLSTTGSTAQYTSTPWMPDYMQDPFSIGISGASTASSAAISWGFQHTYDPIFFPTLGSSLGVIAPSAATWFDHTSLNNVSSAPLSRDGNYAFPVQGIRAVLTSTAAAGVSVTFTAIQAGP